MISQRLARTRLRLWLIGLLSGLLCSCTAPAGSAQPMQPLSAATLPSSSAFPTDLKLTADNRAFLLYVDAGTRQLRVQQPDGTNQMIPTESRPDQTEFSFSLALSPQGEPAIAYVAEPSRHLIYVERRGQRWSAQVIDDDGAVGYFVSLELDRGGRPHLSYFDQTRNDVKYATRTEQGWRIETIDASGQPGFHIPAGFTRIALACAPSPEACSSQQPQVAYLAYRYKPYDGALRYAVRDEQGWQIKTVDATRGAGGFPSLALDRQGHAWISYYRLSTWDFTHGELRLAHYDGRRWQIEVIDQGDYVGRYNALALMEDERPLIAYYATTSGALRLAWQGRRWQIAEVQTTGTQTAWMTLTIDHARVAHLTYADAAAGTTRYITIDQPAREESNAQTLTVEYRRSWRRHHRTDRVLQARGLRRLRQPDAAADLYGEYVGHDAAPGGQPQDLVAIPGPARRSHAQRVSWPQHEQRRGTDAV